MQLLSWLSNRFWWILFLGLTIYGWLLYPLFTHGFTAGPYWMFVFYTQYLGPIELYLAILSYHAAVPIIVISILCFILPKKRYRRLWDDGLKNMLFLPLITLILCPSLIALQPGSISEIKPWHQTYYTAFQAPLFDDTYGDELLIQCQLSGLLCRSIYSNRTSVGGGSFDLIYQNETDQLQVKLHGQDVVYTRSRNQKICDMRSIPNRDCGGN